MNDHDPDSAPAGATGSATPAPRGVLSPALEDNLSRLLATLVRERRLERRWRLALRLFWLGLAIALAWVLVGERLYGNAGVIGPHTALVELSGEIAPDSDSSAEHLIEGLRNAFQAEGSRAVVLRINSPGGSPVQAGIVNDEIRHLKAKYHKKLYAVVEDMCASGAYYVAVAADEIYVDKASLVGSIGVLIDGFGFVGLMDKLGIERRLLTAGENKGMLDPFSPQNDRQKAYAQAMIDEIHRQFIAVVRQGRGNRLKQDSEIFSGLFWSGDDAIKLGLADKLGNLDFVAREVVEADEIVDYTPHESYAEKLARRFGVAVGEGAVRAASALTRMH